MTRISGLALLAVVLSLAPAVSFARHHAMRGHTGSAKSSEKLSHGGPATTETELGTGQAKPPEAPSGNAAINQENAILERKLKSICRGC
jgi:hypothetical protein